MQGNPTQWTNNDVTLSVVVTRKGTLLKEYSFDGGQTWTTSNSKVYTENTNNVQVLAKNILGQTLGPIDIDITKIDKTPPTVNFENSTEYDEDGTPLQVKTLIASLGDNTSVFTGVTTSDAQSGVSELGAKCYRSDTEILTTDYFTQPGRYEVKYKVQDDVGNEQEETRQILVRWPLAGKYIAKVTDLKLDGSDGIAGEGNSSATSPDGLYKDTVDTGYNSSKPFSSKYYYTGASVNNYLSFADKTFRILNIASNDDIKLLGDISVVKTSWGSSKIFESNIYNTWSTKWWPRGQIYNNAELESKYLLFTDTQRAHIDLAIFYAGRVTKEDNLSTIIYNEQNNANDLGGSSASFEGYSAYPNVSDFIKASKCHDTIYSIDQIDTVSAQSRRKLFTNNSWVDMTEEFWTMNGRTNSLLQNDNFWVIACNLGGHFESRDYNTPRKYRVTFYLKNDTILSGTGTLDNAFNVQENWAWFDSCQNVQ